MTTTEPDHVRPDGELATQIGNPLPDAQKVDSSERLHAAPRCPRCDEIMWSALRGDLGFNIRAVVENATLAVRFQARARLLERLIAGLGSSGFDVTCGDSRAAGQLFDELDFGARRPAELYASLAARAAQVLVLRYDMPGAEEMRAAGVRIPDVESI